MDDFAFGSTHKYLQLEITEDQVTEFNQSVAKADKTYSRRMHNICCDNCHSHVARVLNNLKYKGRDNYTMIDVWWMLIVSGKYVSWLHVLYTYLGFLVISGLVVGSIYLAK